MKIVISAFGTRGDVQPAVLWALEAQKREHRVMLIISKGMEYLLNGKDIPYETYSGDAAQELFGKFENSTRANMIILKRVRELVLIQANELPELCANADLIVGSALDPFSKSIAEKYNIPFIRCVMTPIFGGENRLSSLPWQSLPKKINKLVWKLGDLGAEIIFKTPINKGRKILGLPPIRNFKNYIAEAPSLFCLDKRLAPSAPQWPKNIIYTAYPFNTVNEQLPKALLEFINNGEKPIYIGFGSMGNDNPIKTTKIILTAIKNAKVRAIVSKGWANLGGIDLPENVFETEDVCHRSLFLHITGAVHHGGAGTTHTVANAGIPQLIIPHMADQFYYGQSVVENKLGPKPIPFKKLSIENLTKGINNLKSSEYKQTAEEFSKNMISDGPSRVINEMERFVETQLI